MRNLYFSIVQQENQSDESHRPISFVFIDQRIDLGKRDLTIPLHKIQNLPSVSMQSRISWRIEEETFTPSPSVKSDEAGKRLGKAGKKINQRFLRQDQDT